MKRSPRRLLRLAAGAAVLLAAAAWLAAIPDTWSQAARTIKIIVPLAPGGGADIIARIFADQIGRAYGPTVIIDSRPGAGSVIGTEAASRAAPDGNSLLINTANLIIAPHLRKLSYNPLTSFDPVCELVNTALVVVVNPASPYRTLGDLLAAAKAKPGELTLASVGPATTLHIASEKLRRAANVTMTYVPFSGTGPAVTALLGQHVTSLIAEQPAVAEQLRAGTLRALAIGSAQRVDSLPDVPTIAESGYPDFDIDIWWGLFAPAKTPKEALSQLIGWVSAAGQVPEVRAKLALGGLHPTALCGADFAAFLRKQYDEYGRVIREANMKAD
jgi:tripartite-type tricarboxylate transporter receptor subunit TctC